MDIEAPRSFLPPRLLLCGDTTVINNGLLTIRPQDEEVCLTVPKVLQSRLAARVRCIDRTLSGSSIIFDGQQTDDTRATRNLITRMFPGLNDIIMTGATGKERELKFFHGRTLEDYTQVMFAETRRIRDWIITNHLPPTYWQSLELSEQMKGTTSLLDLVEMYQGISIGGVKSKKLKTEDLLQHEVASFLQMMYLYAFVDLTRTPEEARLLRDFVKETGKAFSQQQELIYLFVGLDQNGKCVQKRLSDGGSGDADINGKAINSGNFIVTDLRVRRFGKYIDQIAVLDSGDKTVEAEMLKVARGRPLPITDRERARIILGDKKFIEEFLAIHRTKIPNWHIEKEPMATKTPSSLIPNQEKYFAWRAMDATSKIEIVFEWLSEEGSLAGSWIPYQFERGINFHEFRMRQLLEGILQSLFPYELYGRNWDDSRVQAELFKFAYQKAIAGTGYRPKC